MCRCEITDQSLVFIRCGMTNDEFGFDTTLAGLERQTKRKRIRVYAGIPKSEFPADSFLVQSYFNGSRCYINTIDQGRNLCGISCDGFQCLHRILNNIHARIRLEF